MAETLYQMAIRMCLTFRECGKCPLRNYTGTCLINAISTCNVEDAEEQFAILSKWAKEHPPTKTYKSIFLEKFPKATILDGNTTLICKNNVFGASYDCLRMSSCEKCWNEPYKEGPDDADI